MSSRAILAILLCVLPCSGQILQLPAAADATANSSQPTANYGGDAEFNFGKEGTSNPSATWFLRGHIRFDLSVVAAIGIPQRARLFWYQSRSSAAGCLNVNLHRVTAPWSEGTLTWNNRPSHDAAVAATACVGDSFSLGWKQFEITTLVQGWMSGTFANDGMVIRDPNESTAGARRPGYGHSREAPNAALRPYLELDFGSSFGTGCASQGGSAWSAFAGGLPRPGGSFRIVTQGLLPGSLPGVALGGSNTVWSGGPLPFDLGVFGFPGCHLLVAPDTLVMFAPIAQTSFDLVLVVPNNAALAGLPVFTQTTAFGPLGTFHLGNGVGVRLY